MKKNPLFSLVVVSLTGALFLASSLRADDKDKKDGKNKKDADCSATVRFPGGEKPVKLFNGKDLEGWEGHTGAGGTPKYFTVKEGIIVARNEKENAPKVS